MTARVVSLYPPAEAPVDPATTLAEAQLEQCLACLAAAFGEAFAHDVAQLRLVRAGADIERIEAQFTRHLPGA